MSEKEQIEALKLLRDFLAVAKAMRGAPPDMVEALVAELAIVAAKTDTFLALEHPESHGQRRS